LNPQYKFQFDKIIKNKPKLFLKKKDIERINDEENPKEILNESEERDKKAFGEDYKQTKSFLKYLKVNLTDLRKGFLKENNLSDCDYDTFKKIVSSLKRIPNNLLEDENLIKKIFETYKVNKNTEIKNKDNKTSSKILFSPQIASSKNNIFNEDKISYKNLIDSLIDNQYSENFYNYRNHEIKHCKQKLGILNSKVTESLEILKGEFNKNKKFADSLREDIENRKAIKQQSLNNKNFESGTQEEVNSTIPSLKFINKIFANGKEYSDKYHEIKNLTFSPNPIFHNNIKPSTRFSGNPPFQDTSVNIKPIKECSYYFDEEQRFFKSKGGIIDFQKSEKEKKTHTDLSNLNRIANVNNVVYKKAYDNQVLVEQNDYLRQLAGTQRLYNYKNVNKFFINKKIYRFKFI